MPDPFIVGPSEPIDPDPVDSFQQMNDEIDRQTSEEPVGDPVLPCKEPYVEIWLFDRSPSGIGLADCEIHLPSGKNHSQPLDPNGYLKIENFDVDDPDLDDTMALVTIAGTGKIKLEFLRDDPAKDAPLDAEDAVPGEPPLYLKPPFFDEIEDD